MHHNIKFELQKACNWCTHTTQINLIDAQIPNRVCRMDI